MALAALTDGLLDLLRKGADDFAAPSPVVNMTALIESRGKLIADWSYPGKYKQIPPIPSSPPRPGATTAPRS